MTAVEQGKLNGPSAAIDLMVKHNSIIKRPVIEYKNKLIIGFNEEEYNHQLK
ncbi:MAG: ArsC/Spx/MgsR family protein [Bacteroidota bacterium]